MRAAHRWVIEEIHRLANAGESITPRIACDRG